MVLREAGDAAGYEQATKERTAMRLKDQVALVTGGSRGIGRAIVQAFAAEGAKVAVVYRGSQAAADALAAGVDAEPAGRLWPLQCDVADPAAVRSVRRAGREGLGPVDILVNNAGVIHDDCSCGWSRSDWNKVINTNLGGTYNFCQAVAFP